MSDASDGAEHLSLSIGSSLALINHSERWQTRLWLGKLRSGRPWHASRGEHAIDKCRGHGSSMVKVDKGGSWKELIGLDSARSGVVASDMLGRDIRPFFCCLKLILSESSRPRACQLWLCQTLP